MSRLNFLTIAFFLLFLPLFLYNLGGFGLFDFDEGWYGGVAANIIKTKEPVLLTFNGAPFIDHPPLGFDLEALSFLLFGINEFGARFPSAIFGWGCLIIIYLIGKELFNRFVGISASLMLVSSVWFVFRARSGNLDTVFLFFFLLCFYCGVAVKKRSSWIYALAAGLAAVLMVKAFIGISILLPVILFLYVEKVKIPMKKLLGALLLFGIIILPWVLKSYFAYGVGYFRHLFELALRPGFRFIPDFRNLLSSNAFVYLHSGVGKWYYPALVSFVVLIPIVKKYRQLLPIYSIIIFLLLGFITNTKTEIWHLLPLYPFLYLLLSFFLYFVANFLLSKIRLNRLTLPLMIISVYIVASFQIFQFKGNIKLSDSGLSDLAKTARVAQGRQESLYLDGHDFYPSAVFYSQKNIQHLRILAPSQNTLVGFMENIDTPLLLLTEDWRLKLDRIDESRYEILKKSGSWMLIRVKP